MTDSTLEPFVSVCLLTYNRAQCLPQTIESLLGQTHTNFELLIHDDHSPDGTEAVCREFERRDPRVRYFRNERNLRYAGNQNAAIARASAEMVAIVHDGDAYRPDMLATWIRALEANPTAGLVFNALAYRGDDGRVVCVDRQPFPPLVDGRRLLEFMLRYPASPIWGIVMVRKKCVEAVGPFDDRMPLMADVDMWMRILQRFDAAYVDEPLFTIAGRERDHLNKPWNWRVARERDLIYSLNLERWLKDEADGTRRRYFQKRLDAMLLKEDLAKLTICLTHGRLVALLRGIVYAGSKLAGWKGTAPDSGRRRPGGKS